MENNNFIKFNVDWPRLSEEEIKRLLTNANNNEPTNSLRSVTLYLDKQRTSAKLRVLHVAIRAHFFAFIKPNKKAHKKRKECFIILFLKEGKYTIFKAVQRVYENEQEHMVFTGLNSEDSREIADILANPQKYTLIPHS